MRADDSQPNVYIALLGGLRVWIAGVETEPFPRRKVAALLACLALRPRQIHAREALADALWPEATPEEARRNLRQTLSLLRRQLDGASFVLANTHSLWLEPGVTTDLMEFQEAVRHGNTERARTLWQGELLPGFYEDWVQTERERLNALWQAIPIETATFPITLARPAREGKLPVFLSSFLGREEEIQQIGSRIIQPDVRLVTLVGPGGIGKTRLAVAVASWSGNSPAWFADLSALPVGASVETVAALVAGILGTTPRDGMSPTESVCSFFANRPGRLILDNAEHIVAAVATFATRVLTEVPMLTILATSREPLRVPGEQIIPIGSLNTIEAQTLFMSRARAAHAEVPEDSEAVAEICRRLDGLPLAIEMAAARVRSLSPRDLAERIKDRFRLLEDTGTLTPPRQRTLRTVLDWSYDLLNTEERALFVRLSVFVGGWTLKAAEAICDATPTVLAHLVDRSLVVAEPTSAGSLRYRFLEMIREYATVQREALTEANGDACHADYFAEFAEMAAAQLRGGEQALWMDRLDADHDNLRAAFEFLARTDPSRLLRFATSLWRFWQTRGYLVEGAERLGRALGTSKTNLSLEENALYAEALLGAGDIAYLRGDYERTEDCCAQAMALFQQQGNRRGQAEALQGRGLAAMMRLEYPAARNYLEEAVCAAEDSGDLGALSDALSNLTQILLLSNAPPERAVDAGERAIRLAQEVHDAGRELTGLNLLQWAISVRDGQQAARPLLERALPLARRLGARHIEASILINLAACAQATGETPVAIALFEEGYTKATESGDRFVQFAALRHLCILVAEQGDIAGACGHLDRLLPFAATKGVSPQMLSQVCVCAATVATAQGEMERAVHYFAAARAAWERHGTSPPADEEAWMTAALSVLRHQIPPDAYDRAWNEGKAGAIFRSVSPQSG